MFFQGLDIGLLQEEEVGDAGDDAGLVPADDGDGGERCITVGILTLTSTPAVQFNSFECSQATRKSFDPTRNFPNLACMRTMIIGQ